MPLDKRLLIAEKEPAAERIAAYLGLKSWGLYFEGRDLYLVAARGHILNSTVKGLQGWNLPLFDFVWTIKKQNMERLQLIKMLKDKCEQCVIITDWDREGEVIGERILAYCNNDLNRIDVPQYRVYFSALTATELERGLGDIKPMNESLLAQGHARNYADTIIGLNLTKLLTRIFKKDLGFDELQQALSMGRVQSPSLSYILEGSNIDLNLESRVQDEDMEDRFTYLQTDVGDINVTGGFEDIGDEEVELTGYEERRYEVEQAKPLPTTNDAYTDILLNPATIMDTMESLYLKGYMTYPRTKSTSAPDEVLAGIEEKMKDYGLLQSGNFSIENVPEGESEAGKLPLLPTIEGIEAYQRGLLSRKYLVVFLWLLKRMNDSFAPPLYVNKKIAVFNTSTGPEYLVWSKDLENPEDAIHASGKEESEHRGEIEYLSNPHIEPGTYSLININRVKKRQTVYGGNHYRLVRVNDTELVSWMASAGIGTEATRQLYAPLLRERKYVDGDNIPTQLGEVVNTVIKKSGLDTTLTAQIEHKISQINRISELPDFMSLVQNTTLQFMEKIANINVVEDLDVFQCPEGHVAKLVNRVNKGRLIILLRCETCDKFYPI